MEPALNQSQIHPKPIPVMSPPFKNLLMRSRFWRVNRPCKVRNLPPVIKIRGLFGVDSQPHHHQVDEMSDGKQCSHKNRASPEDSSVFASFLAETSIPGVKYIAQESRHWSGRLFWLAAFLLGVSSSAYLIHGLWDRYQKAPVIITFDSNEQNTNSIPFPAVTLCNVNLISRRKVADLKMELSKMESSDPNYKAINNKLGLIRYLCGTQESFVERTSNAAERAEDYLLAKRDAHQSIRVTDMIHFLIEETVPCGELIKRCKFSTNVISSGECSKIFKPVITATGKCCTFNMLPLPLLLQNPNNTEKRKRSSWFEFDNPLLQGLNPRKHWKESEMDRWAEWDYEKEAVVIPESRLRPVNQARAGLPYGLSLLIEPNLDEYYCAGSDSQGIRFALHSPLELPRMMEYSSAVHLGKEILVEVSPDITRADDDIRDLPLDKRKCFFEKERQLQFYRPYTRENCIEECTAVYIAEKCGCTAFHIPNYDPKHRHKGFCSVEPNSKDHTCIFQAQAFLERDLDGICTGCYPLCESLTYHHQTTMAKLQTSKQMFDDRGIPRQNWGNRTEKVAIMHIFFGAQRTIPKLRKALYGMSDLIANSGGILGLCLGFSVLSGLELVYFLTFRTLGKECRRRGDAENPGERREKRSVPPTLAKRVVKTKTKMINVHPAPLPPTEQAIMNNIWVK